MAHRLQQSSRDSSLSHLHVHRSCDGGQGQRTTPHLPCHCRSWAWTCPKGLRMRRGPPNRA